METPPCTSCGSANTRLEEATFTVHCTDCPEVEALFLRRCPKCCGRLNTNHTERGKDWRLTQHFCSKCGYKTLVKSEILRSVDRKFPYGKGFRATATELSRQQDQA